MTQDPTPVHDQALRDTIIVESPLPGGVDAFVRWLFTLPRAVQIGAIVLGLLAAAAVVVLLWMRRGPIVVWLRTRSRGWKIGLAATAAVALAFVAGFGAVAWHYTQHSNGFCVSCHVMTNAYQRFQASEHSKLECHDCHQQPIAASVRQVVVWIAERPQDIPEHGKLPNRVCARCHIQDRPGSPDSTWQRIVATAGHRVHLNSDSAVLKDVQCVKCHGVEVHKFVPVNQTCGQEGCHEDVRIKLGKMAAQTQMHCVGCHQFTRQVSESHPVDSSRQALVPAGGECFACHEMRERMPGFDPLKDPHRGRCGICHNPHEQTTPAAAFATCGEAACHARADTASPFHRGISAHALESCGSCHRAHDWKASGASCTSCHSDIFSDRPRRARRSASAAPAPAPAPAAAAPRLLLASVVRHGPPAPAQGAAAAPRADSTPLSHRRHREVPCTRCHTSERRHGELTVRTVGDCRSCHHTGESKAGCASCHQASELASQYRVTAPVAVRSAARPKERALPFRHPDHRAVRCARCHTEPVTLAAAGGAECASCHREHHAPTSDCRSCHGTGREVHQRVAHQGCAGSSCHTDAQTLALQPTRNVCLGCHQDKVEHFRGRECARCHQVRWSPGAEAKG